jgi:hypothetical protein
VVDRELALLVGLVEKSRPRPMALDRDLGLGDRLGALGQDDAAQLVTGAELDLVHGRLHLVGDRERLAVGRDLLRGRRVDLVVARRDVLEAGNVPIASTTTFGTSSGRPCRLPGPRRIVLRRLLPAGRSVAVVLGTALLSTSVIDP